MGYSRGSEAVSGREGQSRRGPRGDFRFVRMSEVVANQADVTTWTGTAARAPGG